MSKIYLTSGEDYPALADIIDRELSGSVVEKLTLYEVLEAIRHLDEGLKETASWSDPRQLRLPTMRHYRHVHKNLPGAMFANPNQDERAVVIDILDRIAAFLQKLQIKESAIVREVVDALADLEVGAVRPIFSPKGRTNRPPDPSNVWECRAMAAAALELLVSRKIGAEIRASILRRKEYAPLELLGSRGSKLPMLVAGWRTSFRTGKVKTRSARDTYSELASYKPPTTHDCIKIAQKVLADASRRALQINPPLINSTTLVLDASANQRPL